MYTCLHVRIYMNTQHPRHSTETSERTHFAKHPLSWFATILESTCHLKKSDIHSKANQGSEGSGDIYPPEGVSGRP